MCVMKKLTPTKSLKIPADLHDDLNAIAKRESRTVGKQAIAILRAGVFMCVTKKAARK